MAHSLFEPAPKPLHEKIWQRVRDLNLGATPREIAHTDPALLKQAETLDARGRQQLLQAALTTKPIAPHGAGRR